MEKQIINHSIIAIAFLLTSIPSFSQEKMDDKTLSPYFFIKSENESAEQLPLKSATAEVNIAGVIADVTLKQVYKNQGDRPIEAIYVFPGSTRAAVSGMKMTIGERIIEATIEERNKARQDYEEAKQNGQSASLLEQQRPNVFQMNVANIIPGDEIVVELRYTELLIPDEGIYEFVFPSVVGPRYSNTPEDIASAYDNWVSNPYTEEGKLPFYTFDLNLKLNAGMPVKDVICSTHETDIQFLSQDIVKINLKDSEKFGGNRDFILKYRLQGEQIQSGMLFHEGEKENFFLLMVQPPKQIKSEYITPREYVFIVDVSGSMNGFPLEVSKSLLKNLVGNLRSTDKFNILLFAGSSRFFAEHSVNANETNVKKAIEFLDNQRGGGGTELLPALKRALALEGTENYSRTLIIATDGYVNVEKEAFDLIRKNLGNANFFTFGIGSSVNRFIIEGMAHIGKGMPFIATGKSEAIAMAEEFRKYISSPVLTNIKLQFNGFDVYDVEPIEIPDVFSERPVLVYGKYRGSVVGSVDLTGNTGNKDFKWGLDIKKYTYERTNPALTYLWARERIRILDDYTNLASNDAHANEITALGLKYNLLTAFTSFVAIDSEIRNQAGNITTVKQPLPLPQGVSNYAIGSSAMQKSSGRNNFYKGSLAVMTESISYDRGENEFIFEEEPVYEVMEYSPEFNGGEKAWKEFLMSNLIYSQEARDKGFEGTVYVEFVVNEDGTIEDVSVVRSVFSLLDAEAIRVVKLSNGKWKPAKQNGKSIKASMIIPIKFKL